MKLLHWAIAATAPLFILACNQSTPEAVQEATPQAVKTVAPVATQPIDVQMEVQATPKGNSLMINGQTNLPDGFQLFISTCRHHIEPDGEHCLQTIAQGDQAVTVAGGMFSATLLPANVERVKAGLLEFERDFQEPGLSASRINDFVTLNISGTPTSQSNAILVLIGGASGDLLQGKHTGGGAMRVISYGTKIQM